MAALRPLIQGRSYGVIGYDVLKHFVVEFDYEKKMVTFYDPTQYKYAGAGDIFPATMEMGYDPQIDGELRLAGSLRFEPDLRSTPVPGALRSPRHS